MPGGSGVDDDRQLVGSIVGERYVVDRVIGHGFTGTVYAVHHVGYGRPAALKVLRRRHPSDEIVSRVFHGEAKLAWSVLHPGLCEVFDAGTFSDGTPYFVMERLEGETLAARVARERLSLAAAVDMMMQLLSVVAAVHARDLLLRDLRPHNVFLAYRRGCRPLLKVLDFGLARLVPVERMRQEWNGGRVRKGPEMSSVAAYLSPERARGEHAVVPASDLFAATTLLYESLAGERPFAGGSFDVLAAQICQGAAIPLDQRRTDISPELSAFVAAAFSPDPRARPASAKEMQDELRAIFEGGRKGGALSVLAISGAHPAASPASVERPPVEERSSAAVDGKPSLAAPSSAVPTARPRDPSPRQLMAMPEPRPLEPPDVRTAAGVAVPASSEIPNLDEVYTEETQTKRDLGYLALLCPSTEEAATDPDDENEGATQPRNMDLSLLVDEASADNTDRTVPPPPAEIDVDMSGFEGGSAVARSPGTDRRTPSTVPDGIVEDEETETMQLSAELRARVDQLVGSRAAPLPVLPPIVPPRPRRP
jgi:serine/threonine-protein kinase